MSLELAAELSRVETVGDVPLPVSITFRDITFTVKDRSTGAPKTILNRINGTVRGPPAGSTRCSSACAPPCCS